MQEATQEGASIHERLLQKIAPEVTEETEVVDEQTEVETVAEDEITQEPQENETQETVDEPEGEALEIAQLAEYIGYDADKLDVSESGELVIKTKIDGVEGQATLADLVKSYQLEGHLNKQNMEVVEKQKQLDTQLSEHQTKLNERLSEAESFLGLAYQYMTHEYQNIDWKSLKDEDPTEHNNLKLEYQERDGLIKQAYQNLLNEKQKIFNDQRKALVTDLPKLIPEWSNDKTAEKEYSDIVKYAQRTGYSQDDLNKVTDPKMFSILRKAMLFDQLQGESVKVTKKVKKAPKVVKTGATVAKPSPEIAELNKIRSTIKQSGGKSGVQEWLKRTGKV